MGRVPAIPSTARNTVFRKVPGDGASAVPASRTFFLALLLLLLLLLCRCLFRLLHRLAKFFDRFDTRRFQAILRNIPPHRRVIQRVLQSSSLKHQVSSSAPASIPALAGFPAASDPEE